MTMLTLSRDARRSMVVREYQQLTGLHEDDERDLKSLARAEPTDDGSRHRPILAIRDGRLHAQNYVGIIETRRGTVIEILPKVDLPVHGDRTESLTNTDEDTRQVFLTMLRDWRGLGQARLDGASIRAIRHLDMFEALVHLFLKSVVRLTKRGLARAYRTREANLSCLRGRILFPIHLRENLVDRSRFYVGYDEFTADRPANRLIHLALRRLSAGVRHPANHQRIHQLRVVFSEVPTSTNLADDWTRHRVDRSMRHYDTVMPWVGLFLFGHGLTTFAGPHVSRALLFPMEDVFEDFVTAAIRRHQRRFTVHAQGPTWHLATDSAGGKAFRLRPDVVLMEHQKVRFILDAKWKHLDPSASNHGVLADDVYQLFAYGKRYSCQRVSLVYPATLAFHQTANFRFVGDHLEMACFPFNVSDAEGSVHGLIGHLLG